MSHEACHSQALELLSNWNYDNTPNDNNNDEDASSYTDALRNSMYSTALAGASLKLHIESLKALLQNAVEERGGEEEPHLTMVEEKISESKQMRKSLLKNVLPALAGLMESHRASEKNKNNNNNNKNATKKRDRDPPSREEDEQQVAPKSKDNGNSNTKKAGNAQGRSTSNSTDAMSNNTEINFGQYSKCVADGSLTDNTAKLTKFGRLMGGALSNNATTASSCTTQALSAEDQHKVDRELERLYNTAATQKGKKGLCANKK